GRRCELPPRTNTELAEGSYEVTFDRLLSEAELRGNLGVGQSSRCERHNPAFARGERLGPRLGDAPRPGPAQTEFGHRTREKWRRPALESEIRRPPQGCPRPREGASLPQCTTEIDQSAGKTQLGPRAVEQANGLLQQAEAPVVGTYAGQDVQRRAYDPIAS